MLVDISMAGGLVRNNGMLLLAESPIGVLK